MFLRQRRVQTNFKAMRVFCILLVILGVVLKDASADSGKGVDYSDEAIALRLKTGMVTEAEFPEPIADVTKSVSAEFLQIETIGNRMFLLPLKEFDSYIHVVTQDNISYCLHLIMDEFQAPTRIKITKRVEASAGPQNKEAINTIELMKGLIAGRYPQGSAVLKLCKQEVFNNGKIRIVADKVYEFSAGAKAFVLTFENLGSKPIVVPIEHIEFPGLLAISVDSQVLEARPHAGESKFSGCTTKAYMVVEGKKQ